MVRGAKPSPARAKALDDLVALLDDPVFLLDLVKRIAMVAESRTATPVARLTAAAGLLPIRTREASLSGIIYQLRRERDDLFPSFFSDPSWDMLLDLFEHHQRGRRLTVSSCCLASAAPPTTALRYLKTMIDNGLLRREARPDDARSTYIEFTDDGLERMRDWMERSEKVLQHFLACRSLEAKEERRAPDR